MSPRDHQLVVPLVVREGGRGERSGCEHLGVGRGDPTRRVGEVRAFRVLAEGDEEVCDGLLGPRQIDLRTPADQVEVRWAGDV